MSKKFAFLKTVAAPDVEGAAPQKRRPVAAGTGTARRGRPPGKRSNPDFEQVTIYIRKKTHQDAKIKLLKGEKRQEFSELIEELVGKWLK